MTTSSLWFLAAVFILWAMIAGCVAWVLIPDKVRRRVAGLQNQSDPDQLSEINPWIERIVRFSRPFARLSLPAEGWENSPMRIRFVNAGWRSRSAPYLFFGGKTLLAFSLPLLILMYSGEQLFADGPSSVLAILTLSSALGYYLPNVIINQAIENRQREIFENFPDALDLLTICVEAGLGLDAALMRVADEIQIKSKILGQELQLVMMEMRTGFSKERALRNLGLRTGVEEIDMLVAMLIQSDRFGTSMGESLRIHADNLRVKRRHRAEEAAAKISLKLLFPLIFLIFPTLLLVLVGPSILQIYRVLLPALGGE